MALITPDQKAEIQSYAELYATKVHENKIDAKDKILPLLRTVGKKKLGFLHVPKAFGAFAGNTWKDADFDLVNTLYESTVKTEIEKLLNGQGVRISETQGVKMPNPTNPTNPGVYAPIKGKYISQELAEHRTHDAIKVAYNNFLETKKEPLRGVDVAKDYKIDATQADKFIADLRAQLIGVLSSKEPGIISENLTPEHANHLINSFLRIDLNQIRRDVINRGELTGQYVDQIAANAIRVYNQVMDGQISENVTNECLPVLQTELDAAFAQAGKKVKSPLTRDTGQDLVRALFDKDRSLDKIGGLEDLTAP
jgi:hypothetical protein